MRQTVLTKDCVNDRYAIGTWIFLSVKAMIVLRRGAETFNLIAG